MNKHIFCLIFCLIFSACLKDKTSDETTKRFRPTKHTPGLHGVTYIKKDRHYDGVVQIDCLFFDKNGNLILNFSEDRCHLIPQKGLVFAGSRRTLSLKGLYSKLVWEKPLHGHHDIHIDSQKKNILAVARRPYKIKNQTIWNDGVEVFDLDGKQIYSWYTQDHRNEIQKLIDTFDVNATSYINDDNLHVGIKINSAAFIENSPYQKYSNEFKNGNIVISLNQLSLLIILDPKTNQIVWHYKFSDQPGRGVHSVRQMKNGNFLFFENRARFQELPIGDKSMPQISSLDPITKRVVWTYPRDTTNTFLSIDGCTVFEAPNGNFIISYETNFSVVEITPDGEIVWEWFPPPMNGKKFEVYGVNFISHDDFQLFLKNAKKY